MKRGMMHSFFFFGHVVRFRPTIIFKGELQGRVHKEFIRINRSSPRVDCTMSKSAKSKEQQFKVCYSHTQKFFTVALDPKKHEQLHESYWQSINAKVASLVFCLLASVEGTTIRLEIPLQSPPPRGRPSRATGGDFTAGGGGLLCPKHTIIAHENMQNRSTLSTIAGWFLVVPIARAMSSPHPQPHEPR